MYRYHQRHCHPLEIIILLLLLLFHSQWIDWHDDCSSFGCCGWGWCWFWCWWRFLQMFSLQLLVIQIGIGIRIIIIIHIKHLRRIKIFRWAFTALSSFVQHQFMYSHSSFLIFIFYDFFHHGSFFYFKL